MPYLWYKAFHLIGVVVWFAGLFYLVRLFIYHVEADAEPEPARSILQNQYQIMEKRLYNIITTPGMVLTVAMAGGIIYTNPGIMKSGWLHIKLAFVAVLLAYHVYCGMLMRRLEAGECRWSSKQLRALNEAPTLLLLVIVMLAVFKDNFPTNIAPWIVFGTVVLMAATIQLYARKRRLDKERELGEASPQS